MLNLIALEQTAALVEGKVTPRLSGLLDSIKDEKKVSLAVADPKLGMVTAEDYHSDSEADLCSQCHQQATPALPQPYIRLHNAGSLSSYPESSPFPDPWSATTRYLYNVTGPITLTFQT